MPGASATNAVSLIADGHPLRPPGGSGRKASTTFEPIRTEQTNLVGTPVGDSLLTRFRDMAAELRESFRG